MPDMFVDTEKKLSMEVSQVSHVTQAQNEPGLTMSNLTAEQDATYLYKGIVDESLFVGLLSLTCNRQ